MPDFERRPDQDADASYSALTDALVNERSDVSRDADTDTAGCTGSGGTYSCNGFWVGTTSQGVRLRFELRAQALSMIWSNRST